MSTTSYMQTQTFAADVLLGGRVVGDGDLERSWEIRHIDVPNASGVKESVIEQQAFLTFNQITDLELSEQLQVLANATLDHDLGRRLRDSGRRALMVQLRLDDGTDASASLRSPLVAYGRPTGTPFPAALSTQ